jgi:hypothetical protein
VHVPTLRRRGFVLSVIFTAHCNLHADISDTATTLLLEAGADVVLPKPTPMGLMEQVVRDFIVRGVHAAAAGSK